jgi:hypothetical protein
MFDIEKKMEFVRSLAGSKADQFRGMVRETISSSGEIPSPPAGETGEIMAEEYARRGPDMILAESYEDIGTQLRGGEINIPDNSSSKRGRISDAMSHQVHPLHPDESATPDAGIFPGRGAAISHTGAAEIMKKKLNHFEIEKLAETIKERLESELKIQKERWGEEP